MYEPTKSLHPPDSFDFPFAAYPIQRDFMTNLYSIIENKQIGIFESPTGTGKSLSLICGALKWLDDHDKLVHTDLQERIDVLQTEIVKLETDAKLPGNNWLDSQAGAIRLKSTLCETKIMLEMFVKRLKQNEDLKKRKAHIKKRQTWKKRTKQMDDADAVAKDDTAEVDFLIEDDELIDDDVSDDGDDDPAKVYRAVQIFYCSRTHSQLSQVVNEVKNTVYANTIQIASLASRQNYCINPSVRKLKTNSLINERCLELQKNACKSTTTIADAANGTTMKKSKNTHTIRCACNSQTTIEQLRDAILVDVMDIEELIRLAKDDNACPYYAARQAAHQARMVMLPYQMLLHKRTRQQTGLRLANSVVIIDEAHNLIDTITSIYSAEIRLDQLQRGQQQLLAYKEQYFARFSTKNLLTLNQLIFVVKRLAKLLMDGKATASGMIMAHQLMMDGEFYNIKLNEILDLCERTRLAQKVHGFSMKFAHVRLASDKPTPERPSRVDYLKNLSDKLKKITPPVSAVQPSGPVAVADGSAADLNQSSVIRPLLAFLECLMEKADDGRVLLSYSDTLKSKASMKFVLMNPSSHFEDILKECRAVIVAGGTMQPTAEFKNQLFGSHSDRIRECFFDHVVSADALLPLAVRKGPTGARFLFNFANRDNIELLNELCRTLQNVCNVVPAGVVCFFGSYDYMERFYKFLQANGTLKAISSKKHVFKEPRNSNEVEKMLTEFARAARRQGNGILNGAFLLSVVGGKLSEGLNFSDDLGRCVIVVGLPFPNKNSPELCEKVKYLNSTYHSTAGAEYYENICMKAVNQSIGRAVRHINDYAAVLLLDERYAEERIVKKLPSWISRSLRVPASFSLVQGPLAQFFRCKRKQA